MIDTAESLYERHLRDIIPIYEAIHDKAKDTMRDIVLNKFDVPGDLLRDMTTISGTITDRKFRYRVLKEVREAREKSEKSKKSAKPTNECSDTHGCSTEPSTGLSKPELIKSIEEHIAKYPNKSPNNYYLSELRESRNNFRRGLRELMEEHDVKPSCIVWAQDQLQGVIEHIEESNRLANEAHDKRDADKDVPYVSTN